MAPSMKIDSVSIQVFDDNEQQTKRSQITFPNAETISLGGAQNGQTVRLLNVTTPTDDTDAVNKAYVDATVNNISIKAPVRALSDQARALSEYVNGVTVDGVVLQVNDRFLLIAQANAIENGIWVIAADGAAPTRPSDFQTGFLASGAYAFIDEGNLFLDRSFICITDRGSDTVDTDPLEWVQYSARPSALAGFGLQVGTGNELDVNTSVIPTLDQTNTFTGAKNDFTGTVTVQGSISSTTSLVVPTVTGLNKTLMTSADAAVSVEYVDDEFDSFEYKRTVQAVTTTAVSLADLKVDSVVDGVTLKEGDRVLVKDQTSAIENGIYLVSTNQAVRSDDVPTGSSAHGLFVFTCCGTDNGEQVFVNTNSKESGLVGTNELSFGPLVAQSGVLAGTGLVANGKRIDVVVDNVTMEVDQATNAVQLRDEGITDAKIATATITNARLVNDNVAIQANRGLNGGGVGLLGTTVAIGVDHSIVPDLTAPNTFSAANTFSSGLAVTGDASVSGSITTPQILGLSTDAITSRDSVVNLDFLLNYTNDRAAKDPARVASPLGVDVSIADTASGSTLDGITLNEGDRVLLVHQLNAVENGLYAVGSSGPLVRTNDMAVGASAVGAVVAVVEGGSGSDRLYLCANAINSARVGNNPLEFKIVGQDVNVLAQSGLVPNGDGLDVNADNVTIEVTNDKVQIRDLGITNPKIAEGTISNNRLVNSNVTVNTARGLQGGADLQLGTSTTITVDHTVVPDLEAKNRYSGIQCFENPTASVSQTTGSVVVSGGVGVLGNLYVNSTFNMSDKRLKTDIETLTGSLEVLRRIRGCQFTWDSNVAYNKITDCAGVTTVGVIAQEVQEVAPLVIQDEGEYMAVEYSKLIPYLIESVKELDAEVRTLKRKFSDIQEEESTSNAPMSAPMAPAPST